MEENEFSTHGETSAKATAVTKPTIEIAKIMSNEFLGITELNEYCNFVESDLRKWYEKVETLISAKNESLKIMSEYKNRNKVNAINSKSLLQALNELHRYKCELKFNYLATEKSLKFKKLKYKNVILSYKSAWESALKKYHSDPTFVELQKIEQENAFLGGEIEKQEKLNVDTESVFSEIKKNIQKAFTENIVEFAKAMIQYKEFSISKKQNQLTETQQVQKPKENFGFKLFGMEIPSFKSSICSNLNDDANYTCSIDVSVFDEIMVPSENLENINLDEEAYSFVQNEEQQSTEISKDEEEAAEYLNNYEQSVQSKCRSLPKDPKENLTQVNSKTTPVEDNESRYFRGQASKPSEAFEEVDTQKIKDKLEGNAEMKKEKQKSENVSAELQQSENEAEASKDMQMECEESFSEGSYEKQMENQKAKNYEHQKSSSFSSEDCPPTEENTNDSAGPTGKLSEQNSFKPNPEPETNNFKPFTFFTMESEQSIFKLF